MSIKSILEKFPGGDPATIERLTSKVSALTAELKTAQKAARVAFLEKSASRGGSSLPQERAEAAVAETRKRLDRAQGALIEARERMAGAEAAQAREAERKRLRACRASLRRLNGGGELVDQRMDALAEAVDAVIAEQDVLRGLAGGDHDLWNALANANAAFRFCLSSRLGIMPGLGTGTMIPPERTRWTFYLRTVPEPLIGQNSDAMTAGPKTEAVA